MHDLSAFGKILIIVGIFIVLLGFLILMAGKIPYIGRLPGDILVQRKNFTFYFPLTTGIIISIVLSILFWLIFSRK